MAPKSPILHAYRHLLRASSYLPDSLSRVRIHNEIVNRFRKRSHRPATPETFRALSSYTTKLNRAADFHRKELESVLSLTYGRKGTRRRVLVDELRSTPAPDEDVLPDEMSLQEFINVLEEKDTPKAENPKLRALLKSQKENQAQFERNRLKDLEPQIPKENIWGRSTPVKVRKNMESKWWAKTLSRLAPPVDGEEWGRLRDLARGVLVEEVPVRRANRSVSPDTEKSFQLEDVMGRIRGSHERYDILTKRGLRRLYSTIWAQTPTMTWNSVSSKWETKWGLEYPMSKSGVDAVPRATGNELELFEGVDELLAKMVEPAGKRGRKTERIKRIV